MRYYATFKEEGTIELNWKSKNLDILPLGVKKEKIKELTKKQYDNKQFLSLIDSEVVLNEEFLIAKEKETELYSIKAKCNEIIEWGNVLKNETLTQEQEDWITTRVSELEGQ